MTIQYSVSPQHLFIYQIDNSNNWTDAYGVIQYADKLYRFKGYDIEEDTNEAGYAINPYGLMQVYCDPTFESTCEYGFKGHQNEKSTNLTINFGTTEETRTIAEWYENCVFFKEISKLFF